MDGHTPRRSRLPAAIWNRFLELDHSKGIKDPVDRWYVIRAEQFEKALRGKDPKACADEDVSAYLALM
jgi:hypothetical protein